MTFLLVSKIKMLGRNAIKRCAPSSRQKHITKESDGFHNHSNILTMFEVIWKQFRVWLKVAFISIFECSSLILIAVSIVHFPEIRLESFFKWPCIVTLVVTRSRRSVSRAWTKLGEGKHGGRCWIGRLRCRRARPKRRAMLHNSGSE